MEKLDITVIGGGTIGLGWAESFAKHGHTVTVTDTQDVSSMINSMFPNGEVAFTQNFDDAVRDADLVQECIVERVDVKKDIFMQLADKAPNTAILASATSGIPSSQFSEGNPAADRILIGHPFNPVQVMPLIEVVPHPGTSQETIDRAMEIYSSIDHSPVLIKKETPGFVGNRLQNIFLKEALWLVENDVISVDDLDGLVKNSLGLRWATVGPFEGMNLGGGPEGIGHLIENVGKGLQIEYHNPDMTPDALGKVIKEVTDTFGTGLKNWEEGSAQRDKLAEGILDLRKKEEKK